MLVKVEARILIFPGTDFHFPSTSVPPGTFFKALSKIQIGFTFLVPAHLGSPGKGPLNGCVCVCAVARSSSGGVAIRYVLPVLWTRL